MIDDYLPIFVRCDEIPVVPDCQFHNYIICTALSFSIHCIVAISIGTVHVDGILFDRISIHVVIDKEQRLTNPSYTANICFQAPFFHLYLLVPLISVFFPLKTLNKWPSLFILGVPVIPMIPSVLRMLLNVVLRPGLRPSAHAKEMGVSRVFVHQSLAVLRKTYGLRIRGLVNYSAVGCVVILGWAQTESLQSSIEKFRRWLQANPYTCRIANSSFTSHGDNRLYFEMLLPLSNTDNELDLSFGHLVKQGGELSWVIQQLHRFEKRPYLLNLHIDILHTETMYFNFGKFNGRSWNIEQGFRLDAMMDAVRRYTSILPDLSDAPHQNDSVSIISNEDLVILGCLAKNYFMTWREVSDSFKKIGMVPPSDRTIRRKIIFLRQMYVRPYAEIKNIGLPQRYLVTLYSSSPDSSFRLLKAQASTFPQCRMVSGEKTLVLDIRFPSFITLPQLSFAISTLIPKREQICVLNIDNSYIEKELEQVLQYMILNRPEKI